MNHETGGNGQDISGYVLFLQGDQGAAHLAAHRNLDTGNVKLGHQQLGAWLSGRTGSGSDWLHLQFHMAVFELALGDWDAAYSRFLEEILPSASTTEDALTDAPALLCRLSLSAPEPVILPWQHLRRTALNRMQRPSEPFVELHNLLALAGAGDVARIDQWLRSRPERARSRAERLVEKMGWALSAYVKGSYLAAAILMQSAVPRLPQVGGSRAQNQLFGELVAACWSRVNHDELEPAFARAA